MKTCQTTNNGGIIFFRGISIVAVRLLPKQQVRVRFSHPAQIRYNWYENPVKQYMSKSKIVFYAITHSLGVLAYILLLVSFMNNGKNFFGNSPEILIGMVMLSLFVLSASVTGLLVLGRPIHLYFNGFKKEAFILLFSTLACLFAFTVVILIIIAILK